MDADLPKKSGQGCRLVCLGHYKGSFEACLAGLLISYCLCFGRLIDVYNKINILARTAATEVILGEQRKARGSVVYVGR